jgi:helicase MOV-10
MHTLLHLEELQQEIDVRSYDIQGAELFKSPNGGKYIGLRVPGLAEARPSVLRGDALYVSRADGSDGGKEWQGYVHIVRQEEVSAVCMRVPPCGKRNHL